MAEIYIPVCEKCGEEFWVEIEGQGKFVCPHCDRIYYRFFNQKEETYEIE